MLLLSEEEALAEVVAAVAAFVEDLEEGDEEAVSEVVAEWVVLRLAVDLVLQWVPDMEAEVDTGRQQEMMDMDDLMVHHLLKGEDIRV